MRSWTGSGPGKNYFVSKLHMPSKYGSIFDILENFVSMISYIREHVKYRMKHK